MNHPVAKHFTLPGHSITDLLAVAIEKVLPERDTALRKHRESLWINNYNAVSFGANSKD